MFARIAPRYDLMNRLMTLGLDGRWRRLAAEQVRAGAGDRLLDVCCGTGDLTLELARRYPECSVTGVDFVAEMLTRARGKMATTAGADRRGLVDFQQGDALRLPFADDEFAATTIAWGARNVDDLVGVFAELRRVTKPGGRVVCLDSTTPRGTKTATLHAVWARVFVPAAGALVGSDFDAYRYLPASVETFPDAEALAAIMAAAGLTQVRYRRLGLNAVALHVGTVES